MSFETDIQGQNTQLYPIVTIEPPDMTGDWADRFNRCKFLSTNNVSLEHIHVNNGANSPIPTGAIHHFKPLLVNIPSIKQSIDIESRKFKISNVSLDISNYEYNGERFSDILSDTSLINWKVSIQFVSPSANIFSTIYVVSEGGWDGASFYQAHSGNHGGITIGDTYYPSGVQYGNSDRNSKLTKMLYQGTIRRISHDDEKARIELEDLTEKEAHINLPKLTAPPSDYLPDKYANKPIPMVYGHVDRSPLLPYYSYSEEVGDDSDEVENILEYRLKIDTEQYHEIVEENVNIGNALFTKSGLFVKEGDGYLNLHKTNAELGTPPNEDGSQAGVENFRYEDTSIVLDTDDVSYSEDETETSSNDFTKGRLRVHQIRRFNKVSWEESGDEVQTSVYGGLIQGELQATSAGIGRITGTIDTFTYQSGNWGAAADDSATRDWNAGHFKCILEPISIPNSMAKKEDGSIVPPITRVLVDVDHFSFRTEETTPSGQDVNTSSGHFNHNGTRLFTRWGVWVGAVPVDHTTYASQSSSDRYTTAVSVDNINGNEGIDQILLSAFSTLTSYDNIKIGIPRHDFYVNGSGLDTAFDDDDDVIFNVDTTINDAFVVQTFFLDGITDKDYFVNVKGRINTFSDHPDPIQRIATYSEQELLYLYIDNEVSTITPEDDFFGYNLGLGIGLSEYITQEQINIIYNNQYGDNIVVEGVGVGKAILSVLAAAGISVFIENPIDIIYDILRKELGLAANKVNNDDYREARNAHKDWKFAFTVNKKMTSKELIEDIAKSTKCFPMFRNDGTFGFNTIKSSYTAPDPESPDGTSDYENATLIKQSDVISYSFKKTKPEQIYRKVDVQYYKDYAEDSYLKRTLSYGMGASTYYNIESADDAYLEFESPYIRNESTAEHLRDYLSGQYFNDHLIFNLKLPLKYIGLDLGQILRFEELFQGIKAYGIDYRILDEGEPFSLYFPLFIVTSITKNLDSVSLQCMQLHHSDGFININHWYSISFPDSEPISVDPYLFAPDVITTEFQETDDIIETRNLYIDFSHLNQPFLININDTFDFDEYNTINNTDANMNIFNASNYVQIKSQENSIIVRLAPVYTAVYGYQSIQLGGINEESGNFSFFPDEINLEEFEKFAKPEGWEEGDLLPRLEITRLEQVAQTASLSRPEGLKISEVIKNDELYFDNNYDLKDLLEIR